LTLKVFLHILVVYIKLQESFVEVVVDLMNLANERLVLQWLSFNIDVDCLCLELLEDLKKE